MKTLVAYRPNTIHNALSDFDRYFGSFFGDSVFTPAARSIKHLPAVDVRETEKSYMIEMELPGFDEKNIEIHVDGGKLSIASKQEEEKTDAPEKDSWILRERRVNAFSRSFKLPENANPEEVTADFKNGILSLEIQKRPEAQKRLIKIRG